MTRRRDDRFIHIIGLFNQQASWTALGLSVALGVTEATIYRDVKRLQASGIGIRGTRGKGYRAMNKLELTLPGSGIAPTTAPDPRTSDCIQSDWIRRALRSQRRRALWQCRARRS